jgi:hydrogenase maturation protease
VSQCVACVGNSLRGDDAVGLAVLRLLEGTLPDDVHVIGCEGEPVTLLDAWADCELAIVVDATHSGAEPGTVRRIPAHETRLPDELTRASTHVLGVGEAIELARALGKLPQRTIVYGIEGSRFDTGAPLSPEVAAAAEVVAAAIRRELEQAAAV